jgi:PAS domain S-box-containing protein
MKFYIKPFTKQHESLFCSNKLFSIVSDIDLKKLNSTMLFVSETGLARNRMICTTSEKQNAYKIQFLPKLNPNSQVIEIEINLEQISLKRYKQYLNYLHFSEINKTLTKIRATAIFDRKLNLINFFSTNALSLDELIQRKSDKARLKNWLKLLFAGDVITEINLPFSQIGSSFLRVNINGFGNNKDSVCVCFESSFANDVLVDDSGQIRFNPYILNSIPTDIAIWNLEHKYVYINEHAITDTDLRKWILGKNDFEYCTLKNKPPEIAINRRDAFNKTITSGKPVYLEENYKKADVDFNYLRVFQPIIDHVDHINSVLSYAIDITHLKKTESKLMQESIALEHAMDGIAILNNKSEYIYVNDSHVKMFGYEKEEELIGKTWHIFYDQIEIERLEKEVFPSIAKNGYWTGETRGKLNNGRDIYQEITLTILPDGGLVCICRDRTEYRENKSRLQIAEIISDTINNIIIVTDANQNITWVNKAFEEKTGYEIEEVLGKKPKILQGPETNKKDLMLFKKNLSLEKPFTTEFLNYTKNAIKYWTQINITPIFDNNNRLDRYVAVQNDITALKTAEFNIKNALNKEKDLNEEKSKFVSMASHEIRTPLASIQSSSDLIQMYLSVENVPKDKIQKHLDKITGQISRLSNMVSSLLVVGQINVDKFRIEKKEVDIEKYVQSNISNFFAGNLNSRKIKLTSVGKKRNGFIDPVLMSQVLNNLIVNALKYSQGRPDPEVLLEYLQENFRISVKDFGIGIPEDQIVKIYESFFRARNVENIEGTGLGMAIVKKITEMHKGHIKLSSVVNKGTTVELNFPYN